MLEPSIRISFEHTEKDGTALVTKYPTYRGDVQQESTFKAYTKHHYDSLAAFAHDTGHGDDIKLVLVIGVDKTRGFAMMAYSNNGSSPRSEFTTSVPMVGTASASIWGTWRTEGLVHTNCGPQMCCPPSSAQTTGLTPFSNNDTETVPDEYNQCMFVRHYTIRKRAMMFPTVIRAAVGPHDLGPGGYDNEEAMVEAQSNSDSGSDTASSLMDGGRDDDRSSITSIDSESDIVLHNIATDETDNFDAITDYLFWNPDAESVLVHQHDLALLRETGNSANMSTRLLERRPPITVDRDGVGMIRHPANPSSETRSNGLIEIPPSAPSHILSEIEHDTADGMALPEPRLSSRLEYPPQDVPSCIQEEAADAGGPTDLRSSIVSWRDKVPERWDLLSIGSDSAQESEGIQDTGERPVDGGGFADTRKGEGRPWYLLIPDSPTLGSDCSSVSPRPFESVNTTFLFEPATYPASSSITLLTKAMPCLITVAAKSSFVTVFDVLQALYSLLRLRVTTTEPGFVACASQDATVASFRGKDNRFSDRLKLEERLADGVGRVTTKSYQCYVNFDLDQPRRRSYEEAFECSALLHRDIRPFIRVYSTLKHPSPSVLDLTEHLSSKFNATKLKLVTEVAHHLHHINRLKVSHWDLCPLFAHHTFTATLFQTSASVDSEGTARVSDMGSAFVEPTPLAWSEVLHELIRCSAPELVNPQAFGLSEPQVTKASDVYALGVFASQIFSGSRVYPNPGNTPTIYSMLDGSRPPRPGDPQPFDQTWNAISRLWERSLPPRTTITDVVSVLEAESGLAHSMGPTPYTPSIRPVYPTPAAPWTVNDFSIGEIMILFWCLNQLLQEENEW